MSTNGASALTRLGLVALLVAGSARASEAQSVGTFRWQLRPFCNVVTLAITQNGAVYRLEGTDDQCDGRAAAASVTGTAFPNADGSIGFGLNIVTAPGGRPVHVDAEISVGTFSGTWRDSAGASGVFVLTPGAGNGGSARPLPTTGSSLPAAIVLRQDGGFVAGGAPNVGTIPASGAGVRSMWYPGMAAFRAGVVQGSQWDVANVGFASAALGNNTVATGPNSTAMGHATQASGSASTALGDTTVASGDSSLAVGQSTRASGVASAALGFRATASGSPSIAMGSLTTASGLGSVAMGFSTTASGQGSTAMGGGTTASGFNTTAMGRDSVASGDEAVAAGRTVTATGHGSVALGTRAVAGADGSFAFGDRSSQTLFTVSQPNQFKVRAAGGVEFFSNPEANIGVRLVAGGVQWTSLSDVNAKHRFRDLDGEDVLTKFAAMPVREWSYKAQDAAIRHIGPTAQDFHAAFGLGEEPLRIGTLDADGVALAGVKAVEARTRGLRDDQEALRRRVTALEQALTDALELVRTLTGGR